MWQLKEDEILKNIFIKHKEIKRAAAFFMVLFLCLELTFSCLPLKAYAEELEDRLLMPISSNSLENWPEGPAVYAQTACLMDANTGAILYDKNMNEAQYPASTTKVMTCLLAAEHCSMDEMVTFSRDAVYGIERDSSNVGMDAGQSITMEEAIYCIMLASANEVASAVAEHVAGSTEEFAKMMNEKAKELGCTNTHFVNANGLHNEEHYTTAHDLALITAAYFRNEQLRKIASTTYYEVHATDTQPDDFGIGNHHKMLPGRAYAYEYTVGGKTGFTVMARQTLVTCAEKGDMLLVCAVMRDEAPHQYTDTHDLFEYGFNNFKEWSVADNEKSYTIDNANFFKTDINIFGNSKTLFTLGEDKTDMITLPITADFSECESSLDYEVEDEDTLAEIDYTYKGTYVGSGRILFANPEVTSFKFGENPQPESVSAADLKKGQNVVFVNAVPILIIVGVVILLFFIIFTIGALLKNYSFAQRRRKNIIKKSRRYKSEFDDFDF